jgi:iron complex outermembrane recepter protein
MTTRSTALFRRAAAGGFALAALSAFAQTAAPAAKSETVVLPTFTVSTEQDVGYRATNSVSATRVDTAIKYMPF